MARRSLTWLFPLVWAGAAAAAPVELKAGPRTYRMEPATLALESVSSSGYALRLSAGQPGLGEPGEPRITAAGTEWDLPAAGLTVALGLEGDACVVRLTLSRTGAVAWPVVAPDAHVRALILPRGEGNWVPPAEPGWGEILKDSGSLTEEFSLPCWGLDLGTQTVTYLVPDPFDTEIAYARRDGRIGFSLTRTFTRLDPSRTQEVRIVFGEGTPIQPALEYRKWLQARGRFVPMAEKLQAVPAAARLFGALQAYVWGLPFEMEDVRDWTVFTKQLAGLERADSGSPPGKVWSLLPEDGRKAVRNLLKSEWKDDYVKSEVCRAFAALLSAKTLDGAALGAAFPGALEPAEGWGDGISTAFLRELAASGVDRACLITNDLSSADSRPQVAALADELGYLFAPYDSYDGVHPPGMKDSWETSQFDQALFDHGGVFGANGKPVPGFQGKGRVLNAQAARPYVERRVRTKLGGVPYTAWFVDCDAAGQYFDDFSPEHPATQGADCAARVDRLQWIARTFGIPVGSENASAQAVSAEYFGHGVLTPAIGSWDDKDFDNPRSPYRLGGWWPPEAPDAFFLKTSLKPKYRRSWADPRYRIPLYEAAFHDCVIATHHWITPSLKFKGLETTMALFEQLYNVPPLYHLTREVFARNRDFILAHDRFFSPLHRRLALQPMTGFRWLTPDRLVQVTQFGDGTELAANFSDRPWAGEGWSLPPGAVSSRLGGAQATYTPVVTARH